jgi:hypothetical protein
MKRMVTVFVAFAALGCASSEDPGFTSVTTGETGEAESGETGEPDRFCADPEFDGEIPESPTISECGGQGGGALVFDVFSGFGNGVIEDRSKASPIVEFPDDADVGACCGVSADADEVQSACVSDCARAACNTAIAALEDAVADPTSLKDDQCGMNCALNVAKSIKEWILPQLESRAGYESCLAMADINHDPDIDYTSGEFDGEELNFQKPADACMKFGCLSNVRLRVYCAVDSITATDQLCAMATNDEHPDIPESDRFSVGSSPSKITSGPKGRAKTFPATSHGGFLRQDACDDPSCPLVLETFSLSTEETVDIGPLRAWDLIATLEYAAIGTRVGDTVVFDTGALQFRISGIYAPRNEDGNGNVGGNGKKIELPLELVIANTSPVMATFTGATFSIDELEFRQGQAELRIRVQAAPAEVVE